MNETTPAEVMLEVRGHLLRLLHTLKHMDHFSVDVTFMLQIICEKKQLKQI